MPKDLELKRNALTFEVFEVVRNRGGRLHGLFLSCRPELFEVLLGCDDVDEALLPQAFGAHEVKRGLDPVLDDQIPGFDLAGALALVGGGVEPGADSLLFKSEGKIIWSARSKSELSSGKKLRLCAWRLTIGVFEHDAELQNMFYYLIVMAKAICNARTKSESYDQDPIPDRLHSGHRNCRRK